MLKRHADKHETGSAETSQLSSSARLADGETWLFLGNNFPCVLFPEKRLFKEATEYQGTCPRFQCQFFELSRSPRSPCSLTIYDLTFKKSLSCIWSRVRDPQTPIISAHGFLFQFLTREIYFFSSLSHLFQLSCPNHLHPI